jgi:hypothetical protein
MRGPDVSTRRRPGGRVASIAELVLRPKRGLTPVTPDLGCRHTRHETGLGLPESSGALGPVTPSHLRGRAERVVPRLGARASARPLPGSEGAAWRGAG